MQGMWQKKGVCTPGRGAKPVARGCTASPRLAHASAVNGRRGGTRLAPTPAHSEQN